MTVHVHSSEMIQMYDISVKSWYPCSYIYDPDFDIQSTLVISKSKEPSEVLRDIRTSTYHMCRTEAITKRTTKFHK